MKRVIGLLAVLLTFLAHAASSPEPFVSRYLETTGAGFMMTPEEGVQYALTFAVREPFDHRVYVLLLFENPEGGDPFENVEVLAPAATQLMVKSDRLKTIRNNKRYLVQLFLYADEQRARPLGTHEQEVLFAIPRKLVEQAENDYSVVIK